MIGFCKYDTIYFLISTRLITLFSQNFENQFGAPLLGLAKSIY